MSEKLCIFCRHFDWEKIYPGLPGCDTCGYGADVNGGANCKKRHFEDENPDDAEGVRILFLIAEDCADYDEASE